MARDRLTVCESYVAFGVCKKNRNANHKGYCQTCDKYHPRCKERHINKKKQELDKIKKNERYD